MDSFAERLTLLRESKDLKKKELASILNVSAACISQYESGSIMPGYDILSRMSDYFGVSVDFLIGADRATAKLGLGEVYTGNTTYLGLLNACSQIPANKREALLAMVEALRES